jgi:ribosomal-protein-alanine N-acetyltransferase
MQQLSQSDLPAVLEIETRAFCDPWPEAAFSADILQHAWILEVDDQLCGYIIYHLVLDEAIILNFAIDPDMRRQGHGTHLLSRTLSELEQSGYTRFYLDVRRSNRAAIQLYEKHGFMCLGIRKSYYNDPEEDAILMGKILTNQGNSHDS